MFVVCMNYFTSHGKAFMQNVHFGKKKKKMYCAIVERNSSLKNETKGPLLGRWVFHLTWREQCQVSLHTLIYYEHLMVIF